MLEVDRGEPIRTCGRGIFGSFDGLECVVIRERCVIMVDFMDILEVSDDFAGTFVTLVRCDRSELFAKATSNVAAFG